MMPHMFDNLTEAELREVVNRTPAGDVIIDRLAGKPFASLDEMHAAPPDLYGEELQAAFEAAQERSTIPTLINRSNRMAKQTEGGTAVMDPPAKTIREAH